MREFVCAPGFVLVREVPVEKTSKGGILLPDGVEREGSGQGEVLQAGGAHFDHGAVIKPFVEPGDFAFYPKHAGAAVVVNGENLVMLRPGTIIGKLVKEETSNG